LVNCQLLHIDEVIACGEVLIAAIEAVSKAAVGLLFIDQDETPIVHTR